MTVITTTKNMSKVVLHLHKHWCEAADIWRHISIVMSHCQSQSHTQSSCQYKTLKTNFQDKKKKKIFQYKWFGVIIATIHHIPQAVPTPFRSAPGWELSELESGLTDHHWCTNNEHVLCRWKMSDLLQGRVVKSLVALLKPAVRDIPKRAERCSPRIQG